MKKLYHIVDVRKFCDCQIFQFFMNGLPKSSCELMLIIFYHMITGRIKHCMVMVNLRFSLTAQNSQNFKYLEKPTIHLAYSIIYSTSSTLISDCISIVTATCPYYQYSYVCICWPTNLVTNLLILLICIPILKYQQAFNIGAPQRFLIYI